MSFDAVNEVVGSEINVVFFDRLEIFGLFVVYLTSVMADEYVMAIDSGWFPVGCVHFANGLMIGGKANLCVASSTVGLADDIVDELAVFVSIKVGAGVEGLNLRVGLEVVGEGDLV